MKNVLIIGASSGIGKELALKMASKGYFVLITGRREKLLQEIQQSFPKQINYLVNDVTKLEKLTSFFEEVVNKLKKIDIIVYSSGVGQPNYNLNWELELPTLQTNVLAATKVYGLAYQFFKNQGFGHLVGISSIASIRGNRHVPAYFASKAFQANYLESLWMKASRSKLPIYVTDIQPGFVKTNMAIGKTFWMASPEKAANQIFKAIVKKKKKVYITKRWAIIAFMLKWIPVKLLIKIL